MESNNEWHEALRGLSKEEVRRLPWPARAAVRWLSMPIVLRFFIELIPGAFLALLLLWVPSKPDDDWVSPVASAFVFVAFAVFPTKRLIAALRAANRGKR
ncbi:hypothetical protein QBL02_11870 [Leucobacter sp. UT-8R-CII-1-4]|uniref:hypothetical protein n=1 Tax=Leucobacter sp. UT-8R-CII-1-4 TaxID=3040075 RepID=UPI0024A97D6B|nr:hypothetical protein [Leucobacter sp. UT-8R-CII-1-4]MDI6024239.1 hypothetical protein [Leucobacter sp. UT-8R-CII-1-4]